MATNSEDEQKSEALRLRAKSHLMQSVHTGFFSPHDIVEGYDATDTSDLVAEYKIVIVGDSGVGKTNLFLRYQKQEFASEAHTTIGVDLLSKVYSLPEGYVAVRVWDTAGQERFQTITKGYYRGCVGAVVVYDVNDRKSFERVAFWLKELKLHSYNDDIALFINRE
eukprot:TRINITY_DN2769_c0_g1_i1.p1 TRINITY_DN2769_c0_g1~~TRINITY_DN2769_c0_g1_i1.p1  ORF type:complete len:166 (+),score=32.46 TRINITY_DN2769_c0_g1_i1:212-709(+)